MTLTDIESRVTKNAVRSNRDKNYQEYTIEEVKMYVLWMIIGVAACFVEVFLMGINSIYEFFTGTVVLSVLSAVLFWVMHCKKYNKKEPSFYFTKSVMCMWAGRIILYVLCYFFVEQERLGFPIFWAAMTTLLLVCMRIVQWIYDRTVNKKLYFGYVLIGIAFAFNVAYIVCEYDSISWTFGTWWDYIYMLEHGFAFLLTIVSVIYRYQRYHKVKIKNNEITGRTYRYNAIKMTLLSFALFVFPVYALFLAE